MEEPQRARVKRTLDHMSKHDRSIKYDKYTGEIQYEGVKAFRRERTVVHTSDTDAPADIHLGWR